MLNVKVDKRDPTDLTNSYPLPRPAAPSPTAKQNPENHSHPPKTSPPCSASTPTPCSARGGCSATKACWSSERGRGVSVPAAHPERGAVIERAPALAEYARHHGYRLDELIEIIEDVG